MPDFSRWTKQHIHVRPIKTGRELDAAHDVYASRNDDSLYGVYRQTHFEALWQDLRLYGIRVALSNLLVLLGWKEPS